MTSKYDTYWQDRLDAILALFDQARTAGASSQLPLTGLDALAERGSWYGKLEIVAGQSVYDSAAHLAALGALLTPHLPKWAEEDAWIVTVSKDQQLTAEKTDPRKTNWFENAYRVAKQDETIRRAAAYLGPLTRETEGSGMCRTAASKPVYVLFTAQEHRWLAPRRARLEAAATENGDVVISMTDETSGRFGLWIIPAAELVAAIQKAAFAPSLDRGNAYNFNLQTDEAADLIRQLGWDIRPYRRESGQTELTRAGFRPVGSAPRRRLLKDGMKTPAQRFWKIAPGDDAWQWSECRDNGFIAIGWEELGDLSNLDRAGFEARRAEIKQVHPDWTNDALEQVWKFTLIQEGDRIVANRGTTEVLGIGTVTGPYYFVPGVRHGHRLPVQWDDTTMREVNEGGWRRTLVELTEAKFSALASTAARTSTDDISVAHAESAFSPRAFQLLQGIHEQPTKAYYQAHKDEFKTEVTELFQRIFREVAGRLSALVRASMETEADLFSIFPKNDYGRGGAWDFYWGALYPKGGRRTQDAQLHASIRHDLLKFGFSMGAYGSEQRQRFQRNCQVHHAALINLLHDVFADPRLVFGRAESISVTPEGQIVSTEACTWQEFLADPTRASNTAAVVLPRATVLRTSAEALTADMVQTFERLFPLILLAVEDDPLPAIDRYLNPGSGSTFVGAEAPEPYDADRFLSTTSLSVDDMTELREMLEDRRQIILYGPPGTGKTFVARELGKLLTGLAKPPAERMEIVQFHPAYSYEDFIEGIRPESKAGADGRYMIDYPARPGVFQRFCQQAQSIGGPCVFIIDEINRGNIPRIFGELMLLLEYRGLDVTLAYSGRRFCIPDNVYLIGTMNTADRSIALVDFALRRRFHFFRFSADPELLSRWLEANPVEVPYLLELYRRLSKDAIDDPDFAIGPSHFMRPDLTETQLQRIWRRSIEPYLKEYYVDQRERSKADRWAWDGALVKAIRQGQGNG